ncbi:MAG: hypothetical protein HRU03_09450 [Nanoarchaeales archaeon]|nr:hypothetical protein [Nanoarchaeales archaeon]
MEKKKIIITILTLLSLTAGVNAWGFDIPFTEKKFIIGESWHLLDIIPQVAAVQIESNNVNINNNDINSMNYQNQVIQQEVGIDVSSYVAMYPELAKKYENKVFKIQTDKRIIKGYLSGTRLIEDNTKEVDYVIKVESESIIEEMVSEFQTTNELPSLIELEKQISMPLLLRINLIKTLFN